VSDHLDALAALPPGKEPLVPIGSGGWVNKVIRMYSRMLELG